MPITIETVTQLTGAIVKSLYEGEADTNAFTDTEKSKLGSLSVFSTVSQVDAEAGTSTTVYNWTPERVAQAIAALAGAAIITSVNGATGAVTLDASDIDVVDSGGNFTATTIEGVLAEIFAAIGGGSEVALSSGSFTARVGYIGASEPTISSGGAGDYTVTIPSGTMFLWGNLFANSDTADLGTLNFKLDNSANSADRWLSAQILDANNGGLIDAHNQSMNYTQTISGNITTMAIPSITINGTNGFRIMLS